MRDLLHGYADRGSRMVLLSSHLLHEIGSSPTTSWSSGTAASSPPGARTALLAGAGTQVRTRDHDPASALP